MNASSFRNDITDHSPTVAILAGGLGTRLRPLTTTIPKSMVPVAGEPFIAHQLRLLSRQGFCSVVMCLGHLGEQIESFVGGGSRFGCQVRYSRDGSELLGTGGAIRQALPLLGPQFAVLYGDSYLTAPFRPALQAFLTCGRPALMTLLRNRNQWQPSNVQFAGEIVRYDKDRLVPAMEHIDYGLCFFFAEVFQRWPQSSRFGLSEVLQSLIGEQALATFQVAERFYEIGSIVGLQETDQFLRGSFRRRFAPIQDFSAPSIGAAAVGRDRA
ncbi:NDP-sugar pyrophosphorylase family protein [Silvibacterium bohemicum]|uniref:NDP-sugar pyrophosphorylase family protein n=1 Tax=Silvibacterium bohemicum TaxID=1577686 RepID=A0A841K2N2_9BACT|nr:sugar phosphate nucleotidyltransferase [Silvibacterium bohemicum]MBB6144898.1 NDP-sugar pyrophosphorylase family protein [Silvibacterium bohemicum]